MGQKMATHFFSFLSYFLQDFSRHSLKVYQKSISLDMWSDQLHLSMMSCGSLFLLLLLLFLELLSVTEVSQKSIF